MMKFLYSLVIMIFFVIIGNLTPTLAAESDSAQYLLSEQEEGTLVHFGGYEWVLLEPEEGFMLLAGLANGGEPMKWNTEVNTDWQDSIVNEYVNGEFLNSLENNEWVVEREFPSDEHAPSFTGKVALITQTQFSNYNSIIPNIQDTWWLRYTSLSSSVKVVVRGSTANYMLPNSHSGVRPAIYVRDGLYVDANNHLTTLPLAPRSFLSPVDEQWVKGGEELHISWEPAYWKEGTDFEYVLKTMGEEHIISETATTLLMPNVDGDVDISVYSQSESEQTDSISLKVKVDTAIPTITVNGVEDGATYTTPATISIEAEDYQSGIKEIKAILNGNEISDGHEVKSAGDYHLVVTAIDHVGHKTVLERTFQIAEPTMPTVNVQGGVYNSIQTIALKSENGASIYYTLDGSPPTIDSKRYSLPITINKSTTLKAIAVDKGGNLSEVLTVTYSIDLSPPLIERVHPENGETGVGLQADLVMTFTEPVYVDTGMIRIMSSKDNQTIDVIDVAGANVVGSGTIIITIQPDASLSEMTDYYVLIDETAFYDEAGNYFKGISTAEEWHFQTVYHPSGNVNLSHLEVSSGNLTPAFSSNITSYTVEVEPEISSITITASAEDNRSSLTLNGKIVQPDITTSDTIFVTADTITISDTIPLKKGVNPNQIQVTAEDGATKVYTINVIRRFSDNAFLRNLEVNEGSLQPAFQSDTTKYKVEVDHQVSRITIDAITEDDNASVTINGDKVNSRKLSLTTGENIVSIIVTAENGTTNMYQINIQKASAPKNNNNNSSSGDSFLTDRNENVRTIEVYTVIGGKALELEVLRVEKADGTIQDIVNIDAEFMAEAIDQVTRANQEEVTVYIPILEEAPADEIVIMLSKQSFQSLAESRKKINLKTDRVMITPVMKEPSDYEDSSFIIKSNTVENKTIPTGKPIGQSIVIDSNTTVPTDVTLSFDGIDFPDDEEGLQNFLNSLAVFIEHSDGETVIDNGLIVYDEEDNPIGISVNVQKFSTFTIIIVEKRELPSQSTLKDVEGHWAEQPVSELVEKGAIAGYPDGTFKPNQTITRAEFIALVVKALKIEEPNNTTTFKDIQDHWAKDAIEQAAANKIVSGLTNDRYGPEEPITREQMAAIIVNGGKLQPVGKKSNFQDYSDISGWAEKAVNTAVHYGIMNGLPNQYFKPKQKATRAEAAAVIVNVLNLKQR